MARKRLSDLLREEAKRTDTADTSGKAAAGNGGRGQTARAAQKPPAQDSPAIEDAAIIDVEVAEVVEEIAEEVAEAVELAESLEPIVTELKQTLAETQAREASLQQQITELTSQLEEQSTRVKTLQTDLKKTEHLKAELDEAKSTALRLADANAQLAQELEALRKPVSQPQPTKPQAKPAEKLAPATTSKVALEQKEAMLEHQKQVLAHPMFPNKALPSNLTDQDLGWVD